MILLVSADAVTFSLSLTVVTADFVEAGALSPESVMLALPVRGKV